MIFDRNGSMRGTSTNTIIDKGSKQPSPTMSQETKITAELNGDGLMVNNINVPSSSAVEGTAAFNQHAMSEIVDAMQVAYKYIFI